MAARPARARTDASHGSERSPHLLSGDPDKQCYLPPASAWGCLVCSARPREQSSDGAPVPICFLSKTLKFVGQPTRARRAEGFPRIVPREDKNLRRRSYCEKRSDLR